jgi:hypothetical protein
MLESCNRTFPKTLAAFAAIVFLSAAFPVKYSWAGHGGGGTCAAAPTLVQTQTLNFTTLQVPAASSTYIISSSGGASGTGTSLYGLPAAGSYNISSGSTSETNCSTLTINVSSASCGTGCTLGSWTGKYGNTTLSGAPPWTATKLPGSGTVLALGATATYTSAVPTGAVTPAFTISVHYDSLADSAFPQTGSMGFDIPLSIDTVANVSIGVVQATTAATYTINSAGVLTAGNSTWLGGTLRAGSLLIHGSATQTISISAGSYTASGQGGGVTISNATCSYNGGAEAPCTLSTQAAPTAAGKTLRLGITTTVNKSQSAGTSATPTFTVTVTYS